MDPARRERVSTLFERGLALPVDERPAFLESACRGDADLRSELASLLASHDEAPNSLEAQAESVLPSALARIGEELAGGPSIKSKLSHYEILEQLGGEGMGLVYKARDLALDRMVALKFLPAYLSFSATARDRLKSEARAVSSLEHPNIAVVHEIAMTESTAASGTPGRPFIVMAYYEGETIKRKIARGPLPLRMALDFAVQVAEGLGSAHEAGLVHRDIKPANLIVTDRARVMIVDFGLAITAAATATGSIAFGTAAYMSPEQLRRGVVDRRTDIWSLGVTLYEMLTGRQPFRGAGDRALAHSILAKEPDPVERLRAEVPPAVGDVVRRCLAKDPSGRYADCAALAAALREAATHDPPAQRSGGRDAVTSISGVPAANEKKARRPKEASALPNAGPTDRTPAPTVPPQLAVLPFANQRSDPDIEFLGYALADQVIGRLAYVRGLVVRPAAQMNRYRGKPVDSRRIAEELHIEYVLIGSHVREGAILRLDLELIECVTSRRSWRQTIEAAYDGLLDVPEQIAREVAKKLALAFTPQEQARMERDVPVHADAYRSYQWAVAQPIDTKEGIRSAIDLLVRSLELDPSFAQAFAALGYRYYVLAHLGYVAGHVRNRMLNEAEQALRKALTLNGELLSALSYLALLCLESGRIEEALDAAQRAFAINSNSADACISLCHIYRFAGAFDESERVLAHAQALDPYSPRLLASGLTYLYHGRPEQALELFMRLDQSGHFSLLWQGMALLDMGRHEEARKRFDAVLAMPATSTARWVAEAHLAHMERNFEQGLAAMRTLERMFAPAGEGGEALYHYGRMCIALGDAASGIAMLERAVDEGFFPYPLLRVDPFLDAARADPVFERLLAKARLRHEAFKKTLACCSGPRGNPAG